MSGATGMIVRQAREVARQWVLAEGIRVPDFRGAYLAGSINWLPDDGPLPPTSDVDINVVVDDPARSNSREKLVYRGLLLEVTYLPVERLSSPETVLADYHLAGGFRRPSVLADPSGHLTTLQAIVEREFSRRKWVVRRCAHAREHVVSGLAALDERAPFPAQVLAWLFPTGQMTHILLVAGLRNPTVRRRYAAVRELLAEYRHAELHDSLLELLGCAGMSKVRVEHHLAELTPVFDAAAEVMESLFPFASDITELARPLAIDGSRELLEQGYHREAVFWIAVTYSRCQQVLIQDASTRHQQYEPGYTELLSDLGVTSFSDLQRRKDEALELLPLVWRAAEEIMEMNPDIED